MVKLRRLGIPDLMVIEPRIHRDDRGLFLEAWNSRSLAAAGFHENFVQDNFAHSEQGVLRGLHCQITHPQGKLVRALHGEIFDVCVDLRRSSPTHGQWVGVTLSAADHAALWVPPGFAHGYYVVSDSADVYYKATEFYAPMDERAIRWDDPTLAIAWPLDRAGPPRLGARDAAAPAFADAEQYP